MKAGFIGLGTMGQHMAANLQAAGHELVVHDVRESAAERHLAAGAVWADTPADVMAAVDVVFTSLPTPAVVEEVALGTSGLLESAREGRCGRCTSSSPRSGDGRRLVGCGDPRCLVRCRRDPDR